MSTPPIQPLSSSEIHRVERVYLTGFMGAGKSTVGALLAAKLGWQFVDIDRSIEDEQGSSISSLFENLGEAGFRILELNALRSLHHQSRHVIALGGGILETDAVRTLLSSDAASTVIFLDAPLELLLERCEAQGDAGKRPLLRNLSENSEMIRKRFENRLTHYQKAHLTVSTQDLKPEEVAALIYQQMAAFT